MGSIENIEKLREQHSHRVPDARALEIIRRIRQSFLDLSVEMEDLLPAGREKSLVQTKLDEARMWACNAAVGDCATTERLVINRWRPLDNA
jgi:hypothetical protein